MTDGARTGSMATAIGLFLNQIHRTAQSDAGQRGHLTGAACRVLHEGGAAVKRLSWVGRFSVVQRSAECAHAHPQGRGHRAAGPAGPQFGVEEFRQVIRSRHVQARTVPLRARRHPVQVPPPDVAGELRCRPRLPHPAVAVARAGWSTRTRRGHRRDRQHAAGPQPPAVGDVLRAGPGQRPHRGGRQDPPRAGRRRRVGQPDRARHGPAGRPADRRQTIVPDPPPGARQAAGLGVRRPSAPDRPGAGDGQVHRRTGWPGSGAAPASSPPS